MAGGFYCLMAAMLLKGSSVEESYRQAVTSPSRHYRQPPFSQELPHFKWLLSGTIGSLPESLIESDGYVIHTLEASIWCLLNCSSFEQAVLTAINLGGDTDTTGCIAGGLAGILYGPSAIPEGWIEAIARGEEIQKLFGKFCQPLA
jgi:ADP-ribosyl-[dinitrogen reductase] hydrolase